MIAGVNAEACRTKVSKEKGQIGRLLYAPKVLNKAFEQGVNSRGWEQRRVTFWVAEDENLMRRNDTLPPKEQKAAIEAGGHEPLMPYNQTNFVKERIAVEVQFGKYAFVAHDLSVKHLRSMSRKSSMSAWRSCR